MWLQPQPAFHSCGVKAGFWGAEVTYWLLANVCGALLMPDGDGKLIQDEDEDEEGDAEEGEGESADFHNNVADKTIIRKDSIPACF